MSSCLKPEPEAIDHSVDNFEPELFLTGMISKDSIYLCLTETQKRKFRSDYEPHNCEQPVTDNSCEIDVLEDGMYFCTLNPRQKEKFTSCYNDTGAYSIKYDKYYYTSYQTTKEGATYSVNISHPEFGDLSAETIFPVLPEISIDTNLVYERLAFFNSYGIWVDSLMWCKHLKLKIKDPSESSNFYAFNFEYDSGYPDSYLIHTIKDPLFMNDIKRYNGLYQFPGYLFSDESFNGDQYVLEFAVPKDYLQQISITIDCISEDEYLFQCSNYHYMLTEQDPFSKPISMYSNVNTNIGLFSGSYKMKFDF